MEKRTPLQDLQQQIESGEVDTILLCAPDMQGRLAGKRIAAGRLLNEQKWNMRDCLLSLDLDCRPIAISQGAEGRGVFRLLPDMESLRPIPWLPASALVLCDIAERHGAAVAHAPRQMLRRQQERLQQHGLQARFATRVSCLVFNEDGFDEGREGAFAGAGAALPACNMLASGRQESLLRAVRTHLAAADVPVQESTGMASPGQHEIALGEQAALAAADAHAILKHGVKELAALHERAVTFLAQCGAGLPSNGCILSAALQAPDGDGLFDASDPQAMSPLGRAWLAGQLHLAREMCLFFAPFVNSYRRMAALDDRLRQPVWRRDDYCAPVRIMGEGRDMRMEWEWGGADLNPYLAMAAVVAAGLHGIEAQLQPPTAGELLPGAPALPRCLEEAAEALDQSTVMREALGDGVVDHYLRAAQWELQQGSDPAPDCRGLPAWRAQRGFEQA